MMLHAETEVSASAGEVRRAAIYPLGFLAASAFVVLVLERYVLPGPCPLLSSLGKDDRVELYKQVATASATILGFVIAAVAILVSLDPSRPIVEQLRRGEAFPLLVINLLAAVLFMFVTTVLGIAGAVTDDSRDGATGLQSVFEVFLWAGIGEFALGFFFFSYVTYKAARYR